MTAPVAEFLLISRAPDEVMFRRPSGPVDGATFLAAAQAVAAALPDARYCVNLCQDRYHFAVTLAAAVLRRQVSLLTSDRSEDRLLALAGRFRGAVSVSEDSRVASPLPHHAIVLPAASSGGFGKIPKIPATQLAAIVFTSGSTGEPVGSRKLWGALAERSMAAAARFGITDEAPAELIGTVPPQHMYGLETTVLLPLHAAAASWCGPSFYPTDIERTLAMAPARCILVTTPLQIRALLAAGVAMPPSLQVISATAALPAEMAAEAEARWDATVLEIFGATEVGSVASRRTIEGNLWRAYPGVTIARSGDDVVVTAAFAEPCTLNDEVELVGDDQFRLLGRKADMIKLAGKRASLAGLNRILNDIDGVSDGLFMAPDDLEQRPSARLLAFVVAPDRSAEDILAALRRRIDPIFLPRRVIRVDDLPRNEVGKLPRQTLVALRERLDDAG
jgi:acyl-coenzyme A synthetase/AMP-(fatty) acid ligase